MWSILGVGLTAVYSACSETPRTGRRKGETREGIIFRDLYRSPKSPSVRKLKYRKLLKGMYVITTRG